eukprot:11180374-Lingulodinium_polyedra.AAC.1
MSKAQYIVSAGAEPERTNVGSPGKATAVWKGVLGKFGIMPEGNGDDWAVLVDGAARRAPVVGSGQRACNKA